MVQLIISPSYTTEYSFIFILTCKSSFDVTIVVGITRIDTSSI